jgi:hypothetical protein
MSTCINCTQTPGHLPLSQLAPLERSDSLAGLDPATRRREEKASGLAPVAPVAASS